MGGLGVGGRGGGGVGGGGGVRRGGGERTGGGSSSLNQNPHFFSIFYSFFKIK